MVAKTIHVADFRIKHKGIFDLDNMYKDAYSWFASHGFKFHEQVHKFKPPELQLQWMGERKDTGYRKTEVKLKFHSWYQKDQEVKINGKTKKMTYAAFLIDLSADLILDYDNNFDTEFKKWLQKFSENIILYYHKNIFWPDAIHYELLNLQKTIKKSLEMTAKGGAF